jgi:hypothetical protein
MNPYAELVMAVTIRDNYIDKDFHNLELTPFRGPLHTWERRFHDAEKPQTISARVPAADCLAALKSVQLECESSG